MIHIYPSPSVRLSTISSNDISRWPDFTIILGVVGWFDGARFTASAGHFFLDIFSHGYHFSFLSSKTARYRLKYYLKGPLGVVGWCEGAG